MDNINSGDAETYKSVLKELERWNDYIMTGVKPYADFSGKISDWHSLIHMKFEMEGRPTSIVANTVGDFNPDNEQEVNELMDALRKDNVVKLVPPTKD